MADWWRGAVIYQIYPRSFCDSSGNGIGDLRGITGKLDYVASLGVDAIWISPFFTSPMSDFGYDVSDYRGVDPLFGDLDDFRALLRRAHELGLKVLIDQVLSHSSDQHAWFQESRQDRSNRRADWYVWADPKADGTPPNNWLSVFGGVAWTWDSRRRQYYLHNFLSSQPDLNFHHPDVRAAQLDNLRFWLDLGVDGFRLDVVNYYFHHRELPDNPPAAGRGAAVSPGNPYGYQEHRYDVSQPENLDYLEALRGLLDAYPQSTSIGEIGSSDSLGDMARYTQGGNRLHMAYTFDLLGGRSDAAYLRTVLEQVSVGLGDGWPCWSLSNHDVIRLATRWSRGLAPEQIVPAALTFLLCLRGSVCLYQGDELALPEAAVPFDRLQDPFGRTFWPDFKGRDGCRTPMPWTADETAGFTTSGVEPWLPIGGEHRARCVAAQTAAPDSVLKQVQALLRWRREQPALSDGAQTLIDSGEIIAYLREGAGQRLLVACNLTATAQLLPLPQPPSRVHAPTAACVDQVVGPVRLAPGQVLLADLA
ncbi:MAG: alpha-glucosidase [Pseudomonadota bacterium]